MWKDIRPIIKQGLELIPGMGRVHEHVVHNYSWEDMFGELVDDQRLNAWEITRNTKRSQPDSILDQEAVDANGCLYQDVHGALLVGRMALSDHGESEHEFQDLVDLVTEAFKANQLLGGRLLLLVEPEVLSISHASYGGVLVHEARVRFDAIERVQG